MSTPRRIAVFRALQIGDMLVTVPALRALRRAYPDAHIALIGLPWARDFVRRFGYCDELMIFPGAPGMPEQPADDQALSICLDEVRARHFDLALQMHGSGRLTNALTVEFGAKHTMGFRPDARSAPQHFLIWEPHESEIRRYLRLMQSLGVPLQGEHLEFPVESAERHTAAELLNRHLPLAPRPFVCIHPGARLPSRRWPAERFAAVADAMAEHGYTVVLTGAPEEIEVGAHVRAAMRQPAVNLIGATKTLGVYATLVQQAGLMICNDTSASHFAAAMRTPSVVISSGADVPRWQPLDTSHHRVLWHDVPCRPCEHAVCPTQHECATGVTVEAVIDTACRLLSEGEVHAA